MEVRRSGRQAVGFPPGEAPTKAKNHFYQPSFHPDANELRQALSSLGSGYPRSTDTVRVGVCVRLKYCRGDVERGGAAFSLSPAGRLR